MPQRYIIVGITAVAAMWLYIDRVCFSTLATDMKQELLVPVAPESAASDELSPDEIAAAIKKKRDENPSLSENVELTQAEKMAIQKQKWADRRMSFALGAFFFTYALFQIPMGSLADRFGARKVLALSIGAWSLVTMATGFVGGFFALLGIRLLLGIAESSAYPAAAGLIKNWARPEERGRFSSVVAFGGRVGGAIAPWLTAALAGMLAGVAVVEWFISTSPAPADASGKEPANWRGVFVVYGLCGLLVGFVFWLIVRDRPGAPAPSESTPQPERSFVQRVGVLARSRNMWFYGGLQFGVNLGWAFIVTLLPMYLNEVFAIPLKEVGPMQSTALSIGCIGMIFGGVVTDALRQLLGPRLGRSLPIAATLACCAAVFFVIPGLPSAWAVVVALGVMAFCVDLHNPAIWSFAQDVGGKNVGAALGWGNMWGNLGAALSPVVLTLIHTSMGWNSAFVFCAFAFVAAAVCGFLLDATRPIDASDAS